LLCKFTYQPWGRNKNHMISSVSANWSVEWVRKLQSPMSQKKLSEEGVLCGLLWFRR
jgi:hypothetical protein